MPLTRDYSEVLTVHARANTRMLMSLCLVAVSCAGTFLGNNERDRVMAATATKTSCLWAYILQPVVLARCVKPAPWIDARRCLVPARIVDFETLMSRRVTVWPGYWHRFLPAVVDEQLRVAQVRPVAVLVLLVLELLYSEFAG